MTTTRRTINATPEAIFAVLADGWVFPAWVVGASRMRAVDPNWPHVGSTLQHSFGVWPLVLNDTTTSIQWNPPFRFEIRPEGWPLGAAKVVLEVAPHRRGARVTMIEAPVTGPAMLVPKPLMWLPLYIRNREALHRLAYLAEGGAGRAHDESLAATDRDRAEPRARRHPIRIALLIGAAAAGAVAVVASRRR
ncbi:SRPBCC family protein [Microbacteriaceae bacterium VKM Ac-2854]|nr:SRPBCC family protein [Microbacteriaceae bacterium VKM Ac-2854]